MWSRQREAAAPDPQAPEAEMTPRCRQAREARLLVLKGGVRLGHTRTGRDSQIFNYALPFPLPHRQLPAL